MSQASSLKSQFPKIWFFSKNLIFFGKSGILPKIWQFSANLKCFQKICQNLSKFSKNFKKLSKLSKLSKIVQTIKNCQKLSKLSKIVKIVKIVENCWNCQKMSKIVKIVKKIVKMLVRSCFLITLIKCLKGHKSLGSLCNVKSKSQWVTQSVSQWQGHLLSCCGQLKRSHPEVKHSHLTSQSSYFAFQFPFQQKEEIPCSCRDARWYHSNCRRTTGRRDNWWDRSK